METLNVEVLTLLEEIETKRCGEVRSIHGEVARMVEISTHFNK